MSGSVQTEIQAAKVAYETAVASGKEVITTAEAKLKLLIATATADVAAANASLGNVSFVVKAEADVGAVVLAVESVGPGAVAEVKAAVVKTESVLAKFTKLDWAGVAAAVAAVAGAAVAVVHFGF